MKILLTGAKGMFGQDALKVFTENSYDSISVDIENFNITDETAVNNYFKQIKCDLVLHAAAYTNVEQAETQKEKAFLVNEKGTENIARATAEKNIPIIYISTDYVFDGKKDTPYLPDDKTNPLNVYGKSKLYGELAVKKHNPQYYIVRTSWLYGQNGKNFVGTMINLSKTKKMINVINDQTGSPTWTYELTRGILKIIENRFDYGTYHICGSGSTTWYDFAKKIFELENTNIEVVPVTSEEFPSNVKRPKYSVMENNELCINWQEALKEYLKNRNK